MIKQHLPPPGDDVIICRCGPPAMNKAMRSLLVDIGYTQEMMFEF
jgi:cytochrome-b5 reductase